MFYLGGREFPTCSEQLVTALAEGVRLAVSLPLNAEFVRVDGGAFPRVDALRIDLTGGRIDPARLPPPPSGAGQAVPGIAVGQLRIFGRPVCIEGADVSVDLDASEVAFDFDRSLDGRIVLLPTAWQHGQLLVEASHAALESLILSSARAAGARQGVMIQDALLRLVSRGPHSVGVEVRATAKKLMLKGTFTITAQLDVDDALTARLSQVDCTGEGMIASLGVGLIRPKLKQYEGRTIPLAGFALAGVRLGDLRIDAGDPLCITARFGRGQ